MTPLEMQEKSVNSGEEDGCHGIWMVSELTTSKSYILGWCMEDRCYLESNGFQ